MGISSAGGCQHQPQQQQFDPAKAEGKVDDIKEKLTNDKPSDDKGAMDQLGELLKQVLEALKKEEGKAGGGGGGESDIAKDLKGIEHGIKNAQKAEDPADELQHLKELLQDMQSAGQVE
jgi:hypothetical protein